MPDDPLPDYYKILNVNPEADDDEDFKEVVKAAYRRLAQKYHDDTTQETDRKKAEQRMKDLNNAKEVLLDSAKRREYDTLRKRQQQEARRRAEEARRQDEENKRRQEAWQRAEEARRQREQAAGQQQSSPWESYTDYQRYQNPGHQQQYSSGSFSGPFQPPPQPQWVNQFPQSKRRRIPIWVWVTEALFWLWMSYYGFIYLNSVNKLGLLGDPLLPFVGLSWVVYFIICLVQKNWPAFGVISLLRFIMPVLIIGAVLLGGILGMILLFVPYIIGAIALVIVVGQNPQYRWIAITIGILLIPLVACIGVEVLLNVQVHQLPPTPH